MKQKLHLITMVVSLAVLAGLTSIALARSDPKPPSGGRSPFVVSGSVAQVYPLVDAVLPIQVDNPYSFALIIQELDITVSDASPNCLADNLIVTPVVVPFQVPARGAMKVSTPVRLADDAANACQGQTFALTYNGIGTKR